MYNKLFAKILDSSIWLEESATRLVWMTLLAAMDEDGFCQFASVANLAHRARVPVGDAATATKCLESPDADSSDPDNEGRRVERVEGGWIVLNAGKYRALVTREAIKEQTRVRVARCRAKKRTCNAPVTQSDSDTTTHTRANTDSVPPEEPAAKRKRTASVSAAAKGSPPASDESFLDEMSANTAYQGIDVRREFGKMSAWCKLNGKQPTRRRFVNWLNRADRPMQGQKPWSNTMPLRPEDEPPIERY